MKKYISLLLLLLNGTLSAKASLTLSNQAEISILTCSPGNELYSLFGHTAIYIKDPVQHLNRVYNYGTFDFNTPHFYLKYAKGLLPYQLTTSSFAHFLLNYQYEERSVYSQKLNLDSISRQRMFDLLEENLRPENKSYLYNFLFDNCTTRSRDMIIRSLPTPVHWGIKEVDKNFWNLLDEYLTRSPWVKWGIHTILGQPGNQRASTFEYMFLPDYLMLGLQTAQTADRPLAEAPVTLYKAPETVVKNPWYLSPAFIFAAGALLLILVLWKCRSVRLLNAISFLLFAFSGIVGLLIVFLGFFTAHPITFPNWNILWANPLNLLVMFLILKRTISRITYIYLLIYASLLTIALPVWLLAQPAVPMATLALILLMIYISLRQRQKYIKTY